MSSTLERRATACPHDCPSTCALEVEMTGEGAIGRLYGAADNNYTAGVICAKVARYAERQYHPDRLTRPLRRVGPKGSGKFEPISWDDALSEVAENFSRVTAEYGAEAVWPYYYAGTMGLIQQSAINRFGHVMNYSTMEGTICSMLASVGWMAGTWALTGSDPREMAESDLVVVWGCNPVYTQVQVMTHISRARKERGAKLVVIDPYRTATAEQADMHIALRPGTDGALACAVMHILFRDGHADWPYMEHYTDVPKGLQNHLQSRDPEWASAITGLTVAEIEAFARLYGETARSYIRFGYGFTRSRNGAANMHAASCLPAVTGAWQHRGGGAFFNNGSIYGLDTRVSMAGDATDHDVRMMDQCRIGGVLTGNKSDLKGGPPVMAMLIQNTNPMAVCPDLTKVHEGFARKDLFVCVHEQFMTETAQMADIVLPATTFLEHNDLYQTGGSSFIHLGPKLVEPLGEARSNHDVTRDLAARLGGDHVSFGLSDRELVDRTLTDSKLPGVDVLQQHRWFDVQPDFETCHFLKGFNTSDKKFHFAPNWKMFGAEMDIMPPLPDHMAVIEDSDDEHPFRMVTAPARNFLNSSFTETKSSQEAEGRPTVKIHPEAAASLNISDGDRVRLGNRRADLVIHAELFDGMQPGVVVVESVWPNAAFEEGIGINALIGADRAPPAGGAAFHDTAVWIKPA